MCFLYINLLVGMRTGQRSFKCRAIFFFPTNKCVLTKSCYHRASYEIFIEQVKTLEYYFYHSL